LCFIPTKSFPFSRRFSAVCSPFYFVDTDVFVSKKRVSNVRENEIKSSLSLLPWYLDIN
jgi:hypothetical protein